MSKYEPKPSDIVSITVRYNELHGELDVSNGTMHVSMYHRTNGDMVRMKTDEELAKFFSTIDDCPSVSAEAVCDNNCERCWLDWLKKEVPQPKVDRCVCCGAIIPEGRQVCPVCERRANENKN